jgi:hypothetical protein
MKEKTESETRDHRWIAISGLLFVAAWVGAVEALLLVVASGNSLFPGEALPIVLDISALGLLVWTAAVSVMIGWRSRAVRAGGGLATLSSAITDTSSSDAQIKSSQSN